MVFYNSLYNAFKKRFSKSSRLDDILDRQDYSYANTNIFQNNKQSKRYSFTTSVYVAVSAIYDDVANQPWEYVDVNGDIIDPRSIPEEISNVIDYSSLYGDGISEISGAIAANLALYGNVLLLKNRYSALTLSKSPNHYDELTLVNNDCFKRGKDGNGILIKRNNQWVAIDKTEYVFFKVHNFENNDWGTGVIESNLDFFAAEKSLDKLIADKYDNGVSITHFIGLDKDLSTEELRRRVEIFNKEFSGRNGKKIFFGTGDTKVNAIDSVNLKDLDFIESRKMNLLTTLRLFGVAPDRVGIVDNSNRATTSVAINQYYKMINKYLINIETQINRQFIEPIKPGIYLRFKKYSTGNVNDLERMISVGIISPKVAAQELGYANDFEEADKLYMSSNLIEAGYVAPQPVSQKEQPVVSKKVYEQSEEGLLKYIEDMGGLLEKSATSPKRHQISYLKKSLKSKIDMIKKYEGIIVDLFEKQSRIFLSEFSAATQGFEKADKKTELDSLVTLIMQKISLEYTTGAIRSLHTSGIQRSIININDIEGSDVKFGLSNPRVSRALSKVGALVKRIDDTTRDALKKVIAESVEENLNIIQIQDKIQEKFASFGASRARTIARTESRIAYDEGTQIALEDLGVKTADCVGCSMLSAWVGGPEEKSVSTCGRQNVPVDKLSSQPFHPNHIGTWAPSKQFGE